MYRSFLEVCSLTSEYVSSLVSDILAFCLSVSPLLLGQDFSRGFVGRAYQRCLGLGVVSAIQVWTEEEVDVQDIWLRYTSASLARTLKFSQRLRLAVKPHPMCPAVVHTRFGSKCLRPGFSSANGPWNFMQCT